MKYIIKATFAALFLMISGSIQAQTAEMVMPEEQRLIPGQIVVYLQDDMSPERTSKAFEELNLEILKTDIQPVSTFLTNPGETVLAQLKSHPSFEEYKIHTFEYDSASLKDLKFGGNMTEQQKEEARKRFLQREDRTMMLVRFAYGITSPEAEAILLGIEGVGDFDLRSDPRMVYIKVEKGTESEQMKRLKQLPLVKNVARTAETVATNDF